MFVISYWKHYFGGYYFYILIAWYNSSRVANIIKQGLFSMFILSVCYPHTNPTKVNSIIISNLQQTNLDGTLRTIVKRDIKIPTSQFN